MAAEKESQSKQASSHSCIADADTHTTDHTSRPPLPPPQGSAEFDGVKSTAGTLVDNEGPSDDVEASAGVSEPLYSVFSLNMRRFIVVMATLSTLFSPFSSFIYLPALDTLSEFYNESITRINLSVTTYQILQGIAPMFFGNMADTLGRRPVYVITFLIYLAANLGLAFQSNYAALMVLRALQATGSSPQVALGSAVIADVATPAERASWMSYVSAGIMFAPAIAPTIGGLLAQFLVWRWIFWFLAICCSVYLIVYIFINPETCRKVVDNGEVPPPKLNKTAVQAIQDALRRRRGEPEPLESKEIQRRAAELEAKRPKFQFPNPIASLRCILEPDVFMILLFQAIMVSGFYCMLVPITPVFSDVYGYNQVQIGLCYIPFAAGAAIGSILFGRLLNWNFARHSARLGMKVDRKRAVQLRNFPVERIRLEWVFVPNTLSAAGLLCWGWVLEQRPSLAGPLIVMIFVALGSTGSSSAVNTYLVDLYPDAPATVVAANNLVRCLISAAASAIIQYMIDAMGLGWCYTLIAAITLLGNGLAMATIKWGPKWREARAFRREKKEEATEAARKA